VAAQWLPGGGKAQPDMKPAPPVAASKPQTADASGAGAPGSGKAKPGAGVDAGAGANTATEAGKANAGAPSGGTVGAAQTGGSGARVRMAFVGDVLLADGVEKLMQQNGFDYPYTGVSSLLKEPDLTIANLETPVTERGDRQTKEYVYRSSPKALPALKEAGVDIVNTANNHIKDYGTVGMLDTLDALNKVGIAHVGTGHNLDEALQPVIVTKNGVKLAFLGFSRVVPDNSWKASAKQPGVADTYNYTVPVETIRKAKEQADLVVVLAHWGTERKDTPDPVQTDLAHRYIDAGADLVVASHPHVLQGLESYKGKWIAYSLGNFIFTTNDTPATWETIVLQADCARSGDCSLHAVPILTKWAHPETMAPDAGAKLLERLSALCYGARIGNDGAIVADAAATGPPVKAAAPAAAPVPTTKKK
jgi:poly-gamma-glutamate synthesis protein (capsule biosynthesis protein)